MGLGMYGNRTNQAKNPRKNGTKLFIEFTVSIVCIVFIHIYF